MALFLYLNRIEIINVMTNWGILAVVILVFLGVISLPTLITLLVNNLVNNIIPASLILLGIPVIGVPLFILYGMAKNWDIF